MSSHEAAKGPRLLRNDRIWDSMKEDIRRIYLTENDTLASTMTRIEAIHGFSASARKWKMQLDDWAFEKKLTKKRMAGKISGEGDFGRLNKTSKDRMAHKRQKLSNEWKEVLQKPELLEAGRAAQDYVSQPTFSYETPDEPGLSQHSRETRAYALREYDLEDLNSYTLIQDVDHCPPSRALIREVVDRRIVSDVNSKASNRDHLMVSDITLDSQRWRSPTPVIVAGTSTQSPIFDGAFPQFSSDSSFGPISNWNTSEHTMQLKSSYDCDGAADYPSVFEAIPFGREMRPGITFDCRMLDNLPWFELNKAIEPPGCILTNFSSIKSFCPAAPQTSSERHRVVSRFLNSKFNPRTESSAWDLATHLKQFIPEQNSGDLHKKTRQLLKVSNMFPALQIFQLVIYFSSNNLLSEARTDAFLTWVIDQKYTELLITLLQYQSPTLRSFAARILESTIRIMEPELLGRLLASSVDPRMLSGRNGASLLCSIIDTYLTDQNDVQALLRVGNILLQYGAGVASLDENENPADVLLFIAIQSDHREVAELLVHAGTDINRVLTDDLYVGLDDDDNDMEGNTPIAAAAVYKSPAMITLLLKLGADINSSCVNNIPLLDWAAAVSPQIYNILQPDRLKSQGCVDLPGIIYASGKGHSFLSRYIRGTNELRKTETTQLLERALIAVLAFLQDPVMVNSLLEIGVSTNVPTQKGISPLGYALQHDALEIASLLLHKGADAKAPGLFRYCATNLDALELIIDYGADATKDAGQALCVAAGRHSSDCVALLIESGADINSRGYGLEGDPTPLQWLAFVSSSHERATETAAFLIDCGADVNAPASPRSGRTALQAAARAGNLPLVRYFVDIGADVNAPPANIDGMTALEAAARAGPNSENVRTIFQLLVEAGACLNRAEEGSIPQATTSTLHELIEYNSRSLIRYAINAGADIGLRTCGREGRTPLQLAAEKGQLDIIKLLLQKGANVNAPAANNFGRTALQAAAFFEKPRIEIVKLFLEQGADINAKPATVGGVTALQASAICGHIPVAILLLKAGADVNAKAAIEHGRTAIEGAAEHGRLDMVQLLINAGATGDVGTGVQKAIDAAERNYHFAVADMLKEHQKTLDLFPVV